MSRLYPCAYCTEDGHCKKYSDDKVTSWCVQSPCKDEKTSNGDNFRAMTDEELAVFIDAVQSDAYERGVNETAINDYPNNYGDWLDWLKQAEDGEE